MVFGLGSGRHLVFFFFSMGSMDCIYPGIIDSSGEWMDFGLFSLLAELLHYVHG